MNYFLDTVDSIPNGVGFAVFHWLHLTWLGVGVALTVLCCIWYRRTTEQGKDYWRKTVALLLVLDEIFKDVMLLIGGQYSFGYLPLHLCSINIIAITIHAWKPSKLLDSFLYTACIPGAIAALLFPTWTELPFLNFMHLHSFTVHILLAMYPIVLACGGTIRPGYKDIPKCLLLLVGMAIPIYLINLLLDTNFMFLMEVDAGNPLYIFQQLWGNHLLGFPVLLGAVLIVMYLPLELWRKLHKKKALA